MEIIIPTIIQNMSLLFIPSTPFDLGGGFVTGPDTVTLSGLARVSLTDTDNNDITSDTGRSLLVLDPEWDLQTPVQVSATVSVAGISSYDSDEVDQSSWVIENVMVKKEETPGRATKKIALDITLEIQGEKNYWRMIALYCDRKRINEATTFQKRPNPDLNNQCDRPSSNPDYSSGMLHECL